MDYVILGHPVVMKSRQRRLYLNSSNDNIQEILTLFAGR